MNLWERIKANVLKSIEQNPPMWKDGSAEIGPGNVIIAGTNLSATKEGNEITLNAAGSSGGGMEIHDNEWHSPDFSVTTHDHSGVYDPAGTGNTEATDHVAAHSALTTGVHGADTDIYLENTGHKDAAGGYAGLDIGAKVRQVHLGSGTPDATTFLRGDRTWAVPTAAADTKYMIYINFGSSPTGQMYLT